MLWQRVVTAVILLLVLLPALFYPSPEPFCLVALLFVAAGSWEWARLTGFGRWGSVASGVACGTSCLVLWVAGWLTTPVTGLWALAALVWVVGGGWMLRGGANAWATLPQALRLLIGLCTLVLAWLAVAQARLTGINYLLSILVLVWVADIFAYFCGRRWGGKVVARKLAPSISPGKSWEGVWGGMLGVLLLATAWVGADRAWQVTVPSLYTQLYAAAPWIMVVCVLWLAAMSVVGDLVESLIKRAAGAKDSSGLLPGHGGVLDRLDALLPTLPIAMLLASVWGAPA